MNDGTLSVRDALDDKIDRLFAGKVVRKDLVRKVKVGANVPVFVLEFLLGKYCASSDEMSIQMGLQVVNDTLANNYIRPDESIKAQSKVKENGRYSFIDKVKVRLESQGINYQELRKNYETAGAAKQLPAIVAGEDTWTQYMIDNGTTIGLSDAPVTIGRADDSTLVLNDDYASARHARLFPREGVWYIEDLGSTNGTYLDRQKVTQPTPVPAGVPIRIGKTVLELRR